MNYTDHNTVEELKIAYIGGGSKGWAWGLMSDLANSGDLSGHVALYDIDREAAERNAIIGNKYNDHPDCKSKWDYSVADTLEEALTGADFVVVSILPGTFDEMESDVHAPEKYGIYQSVGDTTGPGGVMRALRTIPQMEVIAKAVKACCPKAWVINYTNPMAICVKALYDTFPDIRAFGCCHEVFGNQALMREMLKDLRGIEGVNRRDIKINVVGVNHFTWITEATWRGMDLFPLYREFCEKYIEGGYSNTSLEDWHNSPDANHRRVKMDLFLRYGWMAAAGDRHLAEFCPSSWYMKDEEHAHSWGYTLTPVSWRKKRQEKRVASGIRKANGEEEIKIKQTGEEGVMQMRALLGLRELVTNVNLPNRGQIPNLPLGTVVETNAVFRDGCLTPVFAGEIPVEIDALVRRIANAQLLLAEAGRERDLEKAFLAFINDPLVNLSFDQARKLFDEMVENTKSYLTEYFR